MQSPPRLLTALLMVLPAAAFLPLLSWWLQVDYNTIGDNTRNVLRGVVPMVTASLLWGLVVSVRAGWSGLIWRRRARLAMPVVFWLIPVCWFLLVALRLAAAPWPAMNMTYIVVLGAAMLLVGFNEELLFRGIVATVARGAGEGSEARVMLVSAIAFGLFHLPNVLAGQALGATLGQVAYAFVMGCALYTSMRLAGSILLPVVMHALWDFSVFASKGVTLGMGASAASSVLTLLTVGLTLAAAVWAARAARHTPAGQAGAA